MKMLLGLGVLAPLALVVPATPGVAEPIGNGCVAAQSLLTPAAFRKYPADSRWRGPWHAPDVRHGPAHLYRTVVRSEGVGPPDFAGHFKVVRAGCGAGTICPLFVNLKTGRVTVLSSLLNVEIDYARADEVGKALGTDDTRLVYRRDSRLLVVLGTRNENMKLSGATLYEWRDNGPRLIRFIPERQLCPGEEKL